MLNKEYRSARIELEQLRRSASETAAKNPIICDEMQVNKLFTVIATGKFELFCT